MSGTYLLAVANQRTAAPVTDRTLRPGDLESLREASATQGYVSLDARFIRGLLAEIDRTRGTAASVSPPTSMEDLLS